MDHIDNFIEIIDKNKKKNLKKEEKSETNLYM